MTTLVKIPSEGVIGEILTLMTYGAIVRYHTGGIEFNEMLEAEDYEVIEDE